MKNNDNYVMKMIFDQLIKSLKKDKVLDQKIIDILREVK